MEIFLRIVADVEQNVIKEFRIKGGATMLELHERIYTQFGLAPGEMGSFYSSNANWDQGEELPMFAFDEGMQSMEETTVHQYFDETDHALYVYDLINMYAFYVEKYREEEEEGFEEFLVISEVGTHPEAGKTPNFSASPDASKAPEEMTEAEITALYGLDDLDDDPLQKGDDSDEEDDLDSYYN